MSKELFKTMLYLPSQAAAETEATIIKWYINPGDSFVKGQALAEVESAKSTFDFEAPCNGVVVNLLFQENCSVPFDSQLIEIETSDETMKSAIPSVSAKESAPAQMDIEAIEKPKSTPQIRTVSLLGIGTYLPADTKTRGNPHRLRSWAPSRRSANRPQHCLSGDSIGPSAPSPPQSRPHGRETGLLFCLCPAGFRYETGAVFPMHAWTIHPGALPREPPSSRHG